MGYMSLTRREGEVIRLTIDPGVDTERLLRLLLRDGITVQLTSASSGKARISIDAPKQVRILFGRSDAG